MSPMTSKFLRWLLGIAVLAATSLVILSRDVPFYARCLYVLLLCCFMVLYRIFKGPRSADMILGIDVLGTLIVGFCGIMQVYTGRSWYIDIGIAWALQSFISTIAFAKFLEGKGLED